MNVCAGVSKKPRLDNELSEHELKIAPKLAELYAARDRTEPKSTERHQANAAITHLKQGGHLRVYCDSPEANLQRSSLNQQFSNRTAESYLDLGMDNSGPHISSGFQRSDRKTRLRTGQHFPAATSLR